MKNKDRFKFILLLLVVIFITQIIIFDKIEKNQVISKTPDVYFIKRISTASIHEFSGKTKLGTLTDSNQVAVSRDLQKYLGWYVVFENISKKMYLVSDTTHQRFRNTIDIYSNKSKQECLKFGIKSDTVRFVCRKTLFPEK
jgi:3D (Asp-Asp-Asp) domain-containing protein